jgi:hypothetical protein
MAESTSLAVRRDDYLILANPDLVHETMAENFGNDRLTAGDLEKIKTPAGGGTHWTLETAEGEQVVKEITGVLVHQHSQRAYYPGEYAGGNEKPDCSSYDGKWGHGSPGDSLAAEGKGCDECPLSQWGSARNGKGQACRMSKRLYILRPGEVLPAVLTLAPGSLQNFRRYLLRLGITPYFGVITRFKLVQAKSGGGILYSQVMPELAGRLDREDLDKVREYREALIAAMAYRGQEQQAVIDADTDEFA